MSFSRAVVKALFLAGSCYCRRLRSGRCMAQILLSSTCKASVGERERERQMKRAELRLLEVLGLLVRMPGEGDVTALPFFRRGAGDSSLFSS
jgi:hypothetical protein